MGGAFCWGSSLLLGEESSIRRGVFYWGRSLVLGEESSVGIYCWGSLLLGEESTVEEVV